MSFILSKITWFIINPSSLIILLLFAGVVFWNKFPRLARTLVASVLILFIAFSLPFLPRYLMYKLETRIPAGKISADIAGVIVLGGVLDVGICSRGHIELGPAADRLVYAVMLVKQHPNAKLVLTGGSGSFNQAQNLREADYLKQLAVEWGIDPQRIIVERDARVTREHPIKLAALIDKNKKWVLVTSGEHMPRSLGCFRKAGFNIIPYPVDYQVYTLAQGVTYNDFVPRVDNLVLANTFFYEWYGLLFYRLMGYTDALYPY